MPDYRLAGCNGCATVGAFCRPLWPLVRYKFFSKKVGQECTNPIEVRFRPGLCVLAKMRRAPLLDAGQECTTYPKRIANKSFVGSIDFLLFGFLDGAVGFTHHLFF